jgi:hypothetical protein
MSLMALVELQRTLQPLVTVEMVGTSLNMAEVEVEVLASEEMEPRAVLVQDRLELEELELQIQ